MVLPGYVPYLPNTVVEPNGYTPPRLQHLSSAARPQLPPDFDSSLLCRSRHWQILSPSVRTPSPSCHGSMAHGISKGHLRGIAHHPQSSGKRFSGNASAICLLDLPSQTLSPEKNSVYTLSFGNYPQVSLSTLTHLELRLTPFPGYLEHQIGTYISPHRSSFPDLTAPCWFPAARRKAIYIIFVVPGTDRVRPGATPPPEQGCLSSARRCANSIFRVFVDSTAPPPSALFRSSCSCFLRSRYLDPLLASVIHLKWTFSQLASRRHAPSTRKSNSTTMELLPCDGRLFRRAVDCVRSERRWAPSFTKLRLEITNQCLGRVLLLPCTNFLPQNVSRNPPLACFGHNLTLPRVPSSVETPRGVKDSLRVVYLWPPISR